MTSIADRARGIRLLSCDVDGVLTDGRLFIADDGSEAKAYSVLDGVGIKLVLAAGITVAWISSGSATSVTHRARMLGVRHVYLGVLDKTAPWDALRSSLDLPPSACAHIGDDLPDLPLFRRCGFAVTVPHAPDAVQAEAHHVTRREGGAGAVREVCDLILAAQGVPPPIMAARAR